ncbi:MAG: hypothetical protein U1G07_23880 [Verrucomicrobiota bacterium]
MNIPADRHDLYAAFGLAAEKAQVLETEAGNVALAFVTLFLKPEQITGEQREMLRSLVDDVNRKTLGTVLKHIKDFGTFDQTLLDTVNVALERRNYLMHKFFRSHNFAIHSDDGRRKMIEELESIQKQLDLAHAMLSGITQSLEALSGRSGMAEKLVEKLVAEGKKVEV